MTDEHSASGDSIWIVRPDPDLADLIPAFTENRHKELAEFEQCLARHDYDTIRRMAHTWKGICSPYGFVYLEGISRSLEQAALAGDEPKMADLMGQIKDYLSKVKIEY